MSSEKEQIFCDKKQISFLSHNTMRNCSTDTTLEKEPVNDPLSMRIQPAILDVNLAYGLKNVKIELPKVNIPNEVLMKHEVDRFRKLFQCKQQTARKSLSLDKINGSNPDCSEGSHLQNKPEVQFEKELKTAAKILNFTCTKCKDNIRYSPNDLQKHFQLLHYGELPLYPCEMCSFSANDFQSFKQHRRIHRSTLVKCELCNDEQIYTLLDLTKHFISKHCVNGHFQCEKCAFSTHDVGTFVQHIHRHKEIPYKCGKCHQENFTEEELQNHLLVHTSMFSFGCHYCSYSTSRKDYLLKHIIALHRDHFIAKEKLEKDKYEKRIVKTPAGLKLVLKRYKIGASKKALWRRKEISSGSDNTGEENAQVLRSVNKIQTNAEELNQCMRDVETNEEKDEVKYTEKRNFVDGMFSATTAQYNKADDGTSYGLGLLKNAVHGPTVLMVKNNKIAVPANYSAKFMGFKMVDGKQHIVIKLLPTNKQNEYLLGQKADPINDGSATPLLQTSDPCGLSSGAIAHVTDQSTLRNNSVHPLTSPPFSCPAHHSGKIKVEKQNNSILYGRSVSETVAPSNIAVGKSSNYLPMKLGSAVPPCDKVTKAGTPNSVSWGNFSPSSHPQVLPPAMTNTLHCDPIKMPFFPELKIQNGGLNNSNGTSNLYYSTSVDSSKEGLLSFHNYSKVDSLDNPCSIRMSTDDRHKEFVSSKTVSFQNSGSESASSYSESMRGLKAEKVVSARSNIDKTYKHINTKNNSVSFKSQSKRGVDSECFMEDQHHGQQYLDTTIGQGFQNVAEKFQENASDCVNSFLMPKITSVFSLQSEQAANYLSPEIKQILQDVLKVKTSQQEFHSKTNNSVKLHSDKLLSGHEARNTAFMHLKSSATACGFQRPPSNVDFHLYKRELNTRCSTNEGTHCGRERQTSRTSFDSQDVDKLSITPGAGTLLKTCTDSVLTQQLVKEKVLSAAQNPSSFSPVLPVLQEQKKTLFFKSLPSGFFVPLHLANQPGQQVASGKFFPSTSSSDGHVTKGVPASFVSNKGPGMILTFSRTVGTVASAANDSSQVLGGITSREVGKITISTSKMKGENDSFGNVRSSCNREASSTAHGSLTSMPFRGPPVTTNALESSVKGISSVKVLSEHRDAVFGSLESVNQQEIKQEQDVYALLPDGQQGAFLKCTTPNKPVVHKPIFFQDNAHYQNCQPKKTRAMQQQLLPKMKPTSHTLADTSQSVSNSVPSLQADNLQFLTPALAQKQTNLSFNNALILPGGLMPANASSASSNPACCVPPVEPVYSTKSAGTRLQKGSIESTQVITANNRNNFGCQKSTWSTQTRTAKVKPRLKQTRSKSSETRGVQRNKNFKRKRKASCPEPPRKKAMLHRKCKEKSQAAVFSESGSPYKQRASKKTVRTLKLLPFNSNQLVKCPRRNQPVVVLNHPDVDVPEVVNVMKTIAKFKGHVLKVSLSKRTIEALLQPAFCNPLDGTTDDFSQKRYRTIKPISPVKERFVLKLTLKKTSKNNYQIVKTTSNNTLKAKFSCWFCGRIFDNQDNWVGHGQRHLMEATRDWNSLMEG
ncbi:zinc finger protein 518A [Chiroxiphia lanceolata]|uniref:zinc finger protein 518A n=1 Tax=Chiroxiphia lanceolata TaxID=296741 RepID=UPI0013CE85BA|nr:zinc finger protein 518A [Chiroxiphia lanceolata]XP_032550308.1 zinc finger protein 518A [Chiroxiphia lanceolata]XP_032550309.1 zinc finger protein 518A [Chiroxiphia lanceolata]XP_032550310.1 zinc finger protein 518A [Chiroxiphia lanceolata]XP_032550311.1 zinc finger protein 518A [Chiroxiphia lanceolata]